jgi:Zn-dependent M28 family amino/carboxypeptidase
LTFPEVAVARLQEHVRVLSAEIGERNFSDPGSLRRARDYIQSRLESYGYGVDVQEYSARLPQEASPKSYANLIAERPGSHSRLGREIVLVGAHYDTAVFTPGADDNASGVAVLLELARLFQSVSSARTVRFAFFSTEEPPFFRTDDMGSRRYVERLKTRAETVSAMLCLEMVGYFSDEKSSQKYPPLLRFFYPSEGNFAAVVGDFGSRQLVRRVAREIRASCRVPVESASLPRPVPGVDFSDHLNFWREGIPAVMVTDTAFYRNPHYHGPTDTPDKLDYILMSELTKGLASAVRALASE